MESQQEEVAQRDGDSSDTWNVGDMKAAGLFRIVVVVKARLADGL